MAQEKTFSYTEAFKFAAHTFIDNVKLFLTFLLIAIGVYCSGVVLFAGIFFLKAAWIKPWSLALILRLIVERNPFLITTSLGFALFSYILWIYYMYQVLRAGFALYNKKEVHWKDFFDAPHFFRFLGAMTLFILKIIAGYILFILPGLYITTKYWFTGFSLIDNSSQSIREDATHAYQISKHALWPILGFWLICIFLNALSHFLFQQIALLASIHAYKQLASHAGSEEAPAAALQEEQKNEDHQ